MIHHKHILQEKLKMHITLPDWKTKIYTMTLTNKNDPSDIVKFTGGLGGLGYNYDINVAPVKPIVSWSDEGIIYISLKKDGQFHVLEKPDNVKIRIQRDRVNRLEEFDHLHYLTSFRKLRMKINVNAKANTSQIQFRKIRAVH